MAHRMVGIVVVGVLVTAVPLALAGCGSSLTDSQRLWCEEHTLLQSVAGEGGRVFDAAKTLGILPPDIESVVAFVQSGDVAVPDPSITPEAFAALLTKWKTTSDYARACLAAFELR